MPATSRPFRWRAASEPAGSQPDPAQAGAGSLKLHCRTTVGPIHWFDVPLTLSGQADSVLLTM